MTLKIAFLHVCFVLATGSIFHNAWSDQIYVPVGRAKIKKSLIAIPLPQSKGTQNLDPMARTFRDLVTHDLEFTSLFEVQDSKAFLEPTTAGITPDSFKFSDWTTLRTDFLLKSALSKNSNGVLEFEVHLYDVNGARQILGKRLEGHSTDITTLAHTASNAVMLALTGRPGMFLSRLSFVCNESGFKEIYVADYDGSNAKQVTKHKTLAFAPAWSPDGSHLAYSVYIKNNHNIKNIDLYEMDLSSGKSSILSARKGMNSGAHYSPDGSKIALTMSFVGNQEIFSLDHASKQVTKLTHSLGFDVDPAWSPDGKKIAFASSRSGNPMIFTMKADGSDVQRITYAGKFNATPSWSPDGKKLAFAGWIDRHFDVFMMNADGSQLERFTRNEGSNEDTVFTPDGNMIGFSSNRGGTRNIYVISLDGKTTHRLTAGLGECQSPRWTQVPSAP